MMDLFLDSMKKKEDLLEHFYNNIRGLSVINYKGETYPIHAILMYAIISSGCLIYKSVHVQLYSFIIEIYVALGLCKNYVHYRDIYE
jgi:hypothetical protein